MTVYLEHFGIRTNPFGLSPKLDFLFKSSSFEESLAHFVYGLDNQEPIIMITGGIGTGKTMSLQSFLFSLGPEFKFALVTNTQVSSLELLKLILEDLEVPCPPEADKSDLLIIFKNYLIEQKSTDARVLIFIDEAQNLKHEVLEEIRLLTNLGQGESQPVQLFLVGQPELEELVNKPELAQLRQRIRVHYRVEPLGREELGGYIQHRMAVAGSKREVFSKGALDRIFKLSGGIPRLVNSLAGEGLLAAFVAGSDIVRPQDISGEVLPGAGAVATQPRRMRAVWAVLIIIFLLAGTEAGFWLIKGEGLVLSRAWVESIGGSLRSGQLEPATGEQVSVETAALPQALDVPDSSQEGSSMEEPTTPELDPAEEPAGGSGIASVDSAAILPALKAPEETFQVHICSFKTEQQTEALMGHLEAKLDAGLFVREIQLEGQPWFRVFIGPVGDRKMAEDLAEGLRAEGIIDYYRVSRYSGDGNS